MKIKKRSGFFTSAPPDGLRLPPVLFRVHFSRHLLVDAVEFGLVFLAGALQIEAFVNPCFTQFVEYGLVRVAFPSAVKVVAFYFDVASISRFRKMVEAVASVGGVGSQADGLVFVDGMGDGDDTHEQVSLVWRFEIDAISWNRIPEITCTAVIVRTL